MKSFINAFKNISFKGRVSSGDYWRFVGINTLIFVLIFFVPIYIGVYTNTDTSTLTYILLIIYSTIIFLPSFTMQVKRLHDINKSGNWIFLCFIPIIGCIILIILLCKDGDKTSNSYGEPPSDNISVSSNINNESVKTNSDKIMANSAIVNNVKAVGIELSDTNIAKNTSILDTKDIKGKSFKNRKKTVIILLILFIISLVVNIYLGLENINLLEEKRTLDKYINTKDNMISKRDEKIQSLNESLYFYENNAVIVPVNDTKYHKYGCSYIYGKNYYIYNIEAAIGYGYEPCTECFLSEDTKVYSDNTLNSKLNHIKDSVNKSNDTSADNYSENLLEQAKSR